MANFRAAASRSSNPTQDGKKKREKKDFKEAVSDLKKERLEAELARRKAVADAARVAEEDEVARMTFGPSYRREG